VTTRKERVMSHFESPEKLLTSVPSLPSPEVIEWDRRRRGGRGDQNGENNLPARPPCERGSYDNDPRNPDGDKEKEDSFVISLV